MSETQPHPPENLIKLKLVTVQEEVQLDVIQLLEEYLDLAKDGKLQTVAIAAFKSNETVCYGYSALRGKVALLGAVDLMQDMLREDIRSQCTDDAAGEEDQPDA